MRRWQVMLGVMMSVAGAAAGPVASVVQAQEVVYLVRHTERLDDSRDSELSAVGKARAARLADTLRDAGITAIFATEYQRTADTARPLATRLGLPVQQVAAGQSGVLIDKLKAAGPSARILVVGHSDTVPELLQLMGHPVEIVIAKGEYDNVFVVVTATKPVVIRLRY
jgi:broad specificity phosphatase PhoE